MPKCVEHLGGAREPDGLALLPDCEGREENGYQTILAPRQAVVWMAGDLKEELSVSAFMNQGALWWTLDRQPAEHKRPRRITQVLSGGVSILMNELDRLNLTQLLLGNDQLGATLPQYCPCMIEAAEVLSFFPELWLQRRVMRLASFF